MIKVTMAIASIALVMCTLLYVQALPLNDTSSIISVTHVTKVDSAHIPLERRHRSWSTGIPSVGDDDDGEDENESTLQEEFSPWETEGESEIVTQNTDESSEEEQLQEEKVLETSIQDDTGVNKEITSDSEDSRGEMIGEARGELNSNEIAEETTTETLDDNSNQMTNRHQSQATMDTEVSEGETTTDETTDTESEQSTSSSTEGPEEETTSEMEQVTSIKYEDTTLLPLSFNSKTGSQSEMKDEGTSERSVDEINETSTQTSTTEGSSESENDSIVQSTTEQESSTLTGSKSKDNSLTEESPSEESREEETNQDETAESTTNLISETTEYDEECESGFIYKPGEDCVDVNECELSVNICRDLTCVNTDGSYECVESTEDEGKDLTTWSIGDETNELCQRCQHTCSLASSSSSPSSSVAFCSCYPGYQLKDDLITCVDVDECAAQLDNCTDDTVCVNREGSYDCKEIDEDEHSSLCPDGYIMIDDTCQDVDECKSNPCSPGQLCRNVYSTYICEDVTCSGENEIIQFKQGQSTEYQCICKDGFEMTQNNTCVDVDECTLNVSICGNGLICINTISSYKCICPVGYKMHGEVCLDINECTDDVHQCQPPSQCINDIGFYHCQCPDGFIWLNESCHKVPDHNFHLHHHEQGDITFRCAQGFTWSSRNNSCVDIDECSTQVDACLYKEASFCVNLPGSFDCFCHSGFTDEFDEQKCLPIANQHIERPQQSIIIASTSTSTAFKLHCNLFYLNNSFTSSSFTLLMMLLVIYKQVMLLSLH